MIATLNRFISKSSDKCRLFFKILRKNIKFSWTKECELAFQQFKKYLSEPPILSTPDEGELFYIYLIVLKHAVSLVLLREVDGQQFLIYFVNKIFTDCQTKYLPLEKLVFGLGLNFAKSHAFFSIASIAVYIQFLLKKFLSKAALFADFSNGPLSSDNLT